MISQQTVFNCDYENCRVTSGCVISDKLLDGYPLGWSKERNNIYCPFHSDFKTDFKNGTDYIEETPGM
jgi:hypothetical protein